MASVSTYLNFPRQTEEAFVFYRSVFGGAFNGPIHRFADMPAQPGQPPLAEADRKLVMHVELPILGGHVLMGTDAPESMGFQCKPGNNVYINLQPDSRAEADRNLVMHVALPILGGHVLMGTDAPESMGFTVPPGNNMYINLEPDTRAETDRLFAELGKGGTFEMALQEMFWGSYWGSLSDRFGVRWMFNCVAK